MRDVLIVIDMQKDFIDGALGTPEAVAIVPKVVEKVKSFEGDVLFTRDTHPEWYMDTQEGRNLPVPHCIEGQPGWEIYPELEQMRKTEAINKISFGSTMLPERLLMMNAMEHIDSITLVGLCTDICVISNALILKAFFPETPMMVDASCCAGVTPESHKNALEAMKMCQIRIINE